MFPAFYRPWAVFRVHLHCEGGNPHLSAPPFQCPADPRSTYNHQLVPSFFDSGWRILIWQMILWKIPLRQGNLWNLLYRILLTFKQLVHPQFVQKLASFIFTNGRTGKRKVSFYMSCVIQNALMNTGVDLLIQKR
jgi:hypothetical protein